MFARARFIGWFGNRKSSCQSKSVFHNADKMDDRYQHRHNFGPRKHKNVSQRPSHATRESSDGYNKFVNDGSFMEMFKRRMEEQNEKREKKASDGDCQSATTTTESSAAGISTSLMSSDVVNTRTSSSVTPANEPKPETTNTTKRSLLSFVGKRRGGKVLKTGTVKKVKKEDEEESGKKDAWAQYLDEVKKYKSQMCSDEDKTRPLVK